MQGPITQIRQDIVMAHDLNVVSVLLAEGDKQHAVARPQREQGEQPLQVELQTHKVFFFQKSSHIHRFLHPATPVLLQHPGRQVPQSVVGYVVRNNPVHRA